MLDTGGRMNRVRGGVLGVDDGRWSDASADDDIGVVNGLEGGNPAILGEIVVVQPEAATQDRITGLTEGIGNPDAGCECLSVIMWGGAYEWGLSGIQGEQVGVLGLTAT